MSICSRTHETVSTDFTLTLDQVALLNEQHGGMAISGASLGVLCHGNHTVELLNPLGLPEGWNAIRRDPTSGLCSRSDTLAALGY